MTWLIPQWAQYVIEAFLVLVVLAIFFFKE